MTAKRKLRKIKDERASVPCVIGDGVVREEAWEDEAGNVVRYNLAFINHFLMSKDNGRVLGYDNAHGLHHRHFMGVIEAYAFTSYDDTVKHFAEEVSALRKESR